MPKKKYDAKYSIHKLREADVLLGQGGAAAPVAGSWSSSVRPAAARRLPQLWS